MKLFFLGISLLFGLFSNAQNIKRIIDKNDVNGLQKYVETVNSFDEMIPVIFRNRELKEVHPFVYAVNNDRIELTKVFVKNKAIFEDFDAQLSIAFVSSISSENSELFNFLVELKPNVNQVCNLYHNYNGLMMAVVKGREDLFFNLKAKSDFNLISDEGNNLFHLIGIDSGLYSANIFNELLLHNNLDINKVNNYGRTPLHYAAKSGSSKLFFELIKHGAKPNDLNDLYIDAVVGGNLKLFKYVRQLTKQDPNWKAYPDMIIEKENTYYGLEHAIKNNNDEVVKVIFEEMFTEVKNVKQDDQIEIVTNILNSRQLENDQFWPLWEVTQSKNKKLFEYLVRSMVRFNELQIEYTAYNSFVEDDYTEIAEVYFTRFEYRSAKRRFGKDYVKNLYKELGITF